MLSAVGGGAIYLFLKQHQQEGSGPITKDKIIAMAFAMTVIILVNVIANWDLFFRKPKRSK